MSSTISQEHTRERFDLVLDVTGLGMWDWNPITSELLFDEGWAAMLGLTVDNLSMTMDDWASRVHPDDMDAAFEAIEAHFAGRTPDYEILHRMRHADGRWVYILSRGKVVERDEDGQPVWFTGTHADVTHLKHAELDALLASQAKDRFVSSISHELRAPLHAISGILEHAIERQTDDETRKLLVTARETGAFLTSLVNDLLDAAEINMADFTIKAADFDLVELMSNMRALFRERASDSGLAVNLDIDIPEGYGKTLVLHSDRARISQILINLLSNAIKFTTEGSVTLRLAPHAAGSVIEVIDTGAGIENVEAIFAPFYSKDEAARLDGLNSTGLGLHICYQLATHLDLALDVTSTPGVGSTFSVIVPWSIMRTPQELEPETVADRVDHTTLQNIRVLVVDDDPINRKVLKLHIVPSGAEAAFAENGERAWQLLENDKFDVVLSDLHMPVMGGLELCERIRKDARLVELPVIVASADSREAAWASCEAHGATEYLQKPFSSADVRTMIASVVGRD